MLRRQFGPSFVRQFAHQHAGSAQRLCTYTPAAAAVQHIVGLIDGPAAAAVSPSSIRGLPQLFRTPSGQLGHRLTRSFASTGQAAAEEGQTEGKLLKVLLFGAFVAVALKLAPNIGCAKVTQALKLLEADTPLLQKSGANRLRLIASLGVADEQLMREGAPGKLLAMLDRDGDPGVMDAALAALDELSKRHDTLEALVLAGGVDVLEQTVEQRWLDDEAAQDTAAALLVALRVQQDHHG